MSASRFMTTKEVADCMRIAPATVYQRLCAKGDFWGVLPVKGLNGRLLWPIEAIHRLLDRNEVVQKS
ncbi:helix-turn-helix domain-containing protein [Burkholderia sp. BE17]|uniref:helix-turn-helix domain-containing protein n=1 Tax=Burkholderia sp. BE17 TaxID=2656644 RepID=UPI00128D3072|nr:helix-turn-helix domain-containing protein [Burkholderia sp. BE17]MPV65847.1 helix-turn-helix domain-containing protein [Burkholderia sp. BE17]